MTTFGDNTAGYHRQELEALEQEFETRLAAGEWGEENDFTPESEHRAEALQWFWDEVSGRA